eukprot:Hpha_TRINITY_DN26028_c0_g1::TRINITY_DN26028_c0_g1_i1::g.115190::m.115190/K18081/MTMR1_2; myotubularin-related protein 1/2
MGGNDEEANSAPVLSTELRRALGAEEQFGSFRFGSFNGPGQVPNNTLNTRPLRLFDVPGEVVWPPPADSPIRERTRPYEMPSPGGAVASARADTPSSSGETGSASSSTPTEEVLPETKAGALFRRQRSPTRSGADDALDDTAVTRRHHRSLTPPFGGTQTPPFSGGGGRGLAGHARNRKGLLMRLAGEVAVRCMQCRLLVPSAGDFVPAELYFTNYRVQFRMTVHNRRTPEDRLRGGGGRVFSIPLTAISRVGQRSRHVLKNIIGDDVPTAPTNSPSPSRLRAVSVPNIPSPSSSPCGPARRFEEEEQPVPSPMSRGRGEKLDFFELQTKGIACYLVHIPSHEDAGVFVQLLGSLLPGQGQADLFCYSYKNAYAKRAHSRLKVPSIGHESLAIADEYDRWAREMRKNDLDISEYWRLSRLNQGFKVSSSYPEVAIVPKTASDSLMEACAAFRTKGRFPICAWVNPKVGAGLVRSSQPKVGLVQWRRSADDEQVLALLRTQRRKNSDEEGPDLQRYQRRLHSGEGMEGLDGGRTKSYAVFDCRPFANAVANRPKGGGYEDVRYYLGASYENLDIANVHEVSDALKRARKVSVAAPGRTGAWVSSMLNTQWLKHIERIIVASIRVAAEVAAGRSCLVHCSDGWDRTTQVVSLAKLLLDPYYRTICGFQVLIQTEWLACGHKLADRHGNVEGVMEQGEISPIFLQWADCVWQVWRQFTMHFEFTELYLLYILDHTTSGRFGNFMCNSEKERREMRLAERTVSLWDHINCPVEEYQHPEFVNALYVPGGAAEILPQSWPRQLLWWEACHSRLDYEWTDIGDTAAEQILHLGRELERARARLRQQGSSSSKGRGRDTIQRLVDRFHVAEGRLTVADSIRMLLEDTVLQNVYDHIDRDRAQVYGACSRTSSGGMAFSSNDLTTAEDARRWVPDELAHCCAECLKPFGFFRRRHHCRSCGNVFCDVHSSRRGVLPAHTEAGQVRLCERCFRQLQVPQLSEKHCCQ